MTLTNDILFAAVLEQLSAGHRAKIAGTGSSMEPTIHAHSDQLELAAIDSLQLGQICLYRRPNGGYAIHRIHRISADSIVLVGDNQVKTETVPPTAVLAQVVTIHRGETQTDATSPAFLAQGYGANKKRLRRFFRRQLGYNLVNFPRRLAKTLLKK